MEEKLENNSPTNNYTFLKKVQFSMGDTSQAEAAYEWQRKSSTVSLPLLAGEDDDMTRNGQKTLTFYDDDTMLNARKLKRSSETGSQCSLASDRSRLNWVSSRIAAKRALITTLSGLYAMLVLILSLAFEVSIVVVKSVEPSKYDLFYIYLYGLALLFFAYCYAFLFQKRQILESVNNIRGFCGGNHTDTHENLAALILQNNPNVITVPLSSKRKITHSAPSAGSLYLRLGCVVFGVVGMISKGLQLFIAIEIGLNSKCLVITSLLENVLAMIFIFVQMFFIFQNSKLVIHRYKSIARLGMMHLIATNLCLWIRSLVQEQYEGSQAIRGLGHKTPGVSTAPVTTALYDHARILVSAYGLQMPNISSSTNLTNTTIQNDFCSSHGHGDNHTSIGWLIQDAKPFMVTCIVEYSLICSAVTYILWRNVGYVVKATQRSRKQHFQVDCSSSTRGLFIGLLFMVFTIISMVVFFTKTSSKKNYEAIWIFYASDSILYVVSIFALAMGMVRLRHLYYMASIKKNTLLLDDILLIVGLLGQLLFCVFAIVPLHAASLTAVMVVITSLLRMAEVLLQTVFIFFGQRLAAASSRARSKNPGREMVTFLLMTNLSMFLINTFETQKAGSNPVMSDFYGEGIWTVIVYSTVPLSIFYRFHSTVCLAEIWKQAYRVKTTSETIL